MTDQVLDSYERLLIQPARMVSVFLYAAHFVEANHLQIGVGIESSSGLQKNHVVGPCVHELHTYLLTDWLRERGQPLITDEPLGRIHPFSSTMDVDLMRVLHNSEVMPLSADRYLPMIDEPLISGKLSREFADLIERVHIKAWGHPRDWDMRHHELNDGRFIWMAYDSDIRKIRVGMGFHNEDNVKQYGVHTYAVGQREAAGFAAFHYYYLDAPLQFMGQPPRWPSQLSHFLVGEPKQRFTGTFLKLADEVWPGAVDPA